jgi:flavin-dependent dehydrogenase
MPLDASSAPLAGESACDVLVIGGGPAGSTAATLLAERGRRVVLLEKDRHPRFHIGESLLPLNLRIFERLGVADRVAAIGVYKPGARFVSDAHGRHAVFSFAAGLNQDFTHAWQVRRSSFDELLFARAREAGADAREGVRVLDVALDARGGHRAVARDAAGAMHAFRARYVMDCSGRDTLLATALGAKARNPRNNTAALYGHFTGVAPFGARDEGSPLGARDDGAPPGTAEDGNITIHLFDEGWLWMIPLPGGVMSVGVVSNPGFFKRRRGEPRDFLLETLRGIPSVAQRIAGASLVGEVTTTGNYSYASTVMHGEGWLMAGDAYAFVDPVFSSGVLLAMASAEMGSEVADAWLDDPARAAPLARAFEGKVKRAIRTLSWLIYRINTPVLRDMFMAPSNRFRMRDGLISLLAGDVHANANRQMPVLAFKAAYHGLTLAYRLGWRLGPQGLARARRTAPAPPLKAPAAG